MKQLTSNKIQNNRVTCSHAHASPVSCQLSQGRTAEPSVVKCPRTRGALLLELLVVISLLAVILSIGSQSVFVSMRSSKISNENDTAMGLANEAMEAMRSITEEKWQNLYLVGGKGVTHYSATSTNPVGKWSITTGDETIVQNGTTFTRYAIISDVNRCSDSVRGIASSTTCTPLTTDYIDDPSTQKVTVNVSWPNADPVSLTQYFFRWKNKVCSQSNWTGASTTGNGVRPCVTTLDYDTIDTTATTTGGTLQLI